MCMCVCVQGVRAGATAGVGVDEEADALQAQNQRVHEPRRRRAPRAGVRAPGEHRRQQGAHERGAEQDQDGDRAARVHVPAADDDEEEAAARYAAAT